MILVYLFLIFLCAEMPFTWIRPLLDHPANDIISEYIERYDPTKFFQKEKWHIWHDRLLKGRDTFHKHIPRHLSLTSLPKGHVPKFVFDSKLWTPLEHNVIGTKDPKGNIYTHNLDCFLCIEPINKVKVPPQEPIHFLGLEIIFGYLPRWSPWFKIWGNVM